MGGDPPPTKCVSPALPAPLHPQKCGFSPPPHRILVGGMGHNGDGGEMERGGVDAVAPQHVGRSGGAPPPPPQTGVTPNRAHRAPYGVPHLGFPRPRMFMGPLWGLKFRVSPTHHVDGVPTGASPIVSRVGGIGGAWWGWRGSLRGSGGALWGRRPPLAPFFWWPRAQTGCVHGGPLQGAAHCRQRIRILCTLRGQRG